MSLCHNANHQFFAISYEAAISIDLVELFSNVLILVRGLYKNMGVQSAPEGAQILANVLGSLLI